LGAAGRAGGGVGSTGVAPGSALPRIGRSSGHGTVVVWVVSVGVDSVVEGVVSVVVGVDSVGVDSVSGGVVSVVVQVDASGEHGTSAARTVAVIARPAAHRRIDRPARSPLGTAKTIDDSVRACIAPS
jgi:hypothetical protein